MWARDARIEASRAAAKDWGGEATDSRRTIGHPQRAPTSPAAINEKQRAGFKC